MTSSGTVTIGNGTLAAQPTNMRGLVTVSGAGSQWTINDALAMRRGSLTIADGGVVSATSAVLGYDLAPASPMPRSMRW
jgi:fibronectin-binding autotransporter adhesin